MLTIVASSAVISWATAMMASTAHRRSKGCGDPGTAALLLVISSIPIVLQTIRPW
jgi:hypothetical protein